MNNDDVLVTVKCTVFNHEPYLRKCLDGFVMQRTNFKFKVLVHDDASTDNSALIIKEYAEKYPKIIVPMFEEQNQYKLGGFYRIIDIMNRCILGKYIAICEGDDFWIDEFKLQKQVDYMENHKECGLVYTRMKQLNQETGQISPGWAHQANFEDIISGDNPISTPTTLIRRSLYDEFYAKNIVSADWKMADYPLWIYLAHQSKIRCLEDITAVYRCLSHSASHSSNLRTMLDFTYSGYYISSFFAKYFERKDLLPKINKHFQNCLFKLSRQFNKNISVEILRFGIKNHAVTMRFLLKCALYSFCIRKVL